MAAGNNTAQTVQTLLTPVVEELGYEIWDVEYVKEGSRWYLRITIDTDAEGGITIDDCEKVHRAIDPVLDEADPIEGAYYLEVSSPGVERELKTDRQIEAFLGAEAEIRLFAPVDGARSYTGILERYENGELTVTVTLQNGQKGAEKTFRRADISKLHTIFRFD